MSIEEAFKLSQEQKLPITHRFFSDNEFIRIVGNMVILEDGIRMFKNEFLHYRKGEVFNKDWGIKTYGTTYKLKNLEYYMINCRNRIHALESFLHNKIGVTFENIEEFKGEIPSDAKIIEATSKLNK